MNNKKIVHKFTIHFNRKDIGHNQVIELLNNQGRYGKAQYIVNAVLYYENAINTGQSGLDRNSLHKFLNCHPLESITNNDIAQSKNQNSDKHNVEAGLSMENIHNRNNDEALGDDSIYAITDVLDIFRSNT